MNNVQGNGNVVSREIQVSSFIRLHLSGKGLIELIQSNEEKVVIEADENLQDYFAVMNSGRTLYISTEAKFRKPVFTKCHIRVYLRQIHMLHVSCEEGNVICPEAITLTTPLEVKIQSVGNTELNIQAPLIKLLSQTVGDVRLKGQCGALEIKNQSTGSFFSREMIAGGLIIKNMSTGNVELCAAKTIAIAHYGTGYIHYYGDAVLTDVKQHGTGQIKHMG